MADNNKERKGHKRKNGFNGARIVFSVQSITGSDGAFNCQYIPIGIIIFKFTLLKKRDYIFHNTRTITSITLPEGCLLSSDPRRDNAFAVSERFAATLSGSTLKLHRNYSSG